MGRSSAEEEKKQNNKIATTLTSHATYKVATTVQCTVLYYSTHFSLSILSITMNIIIKEQKKYLQYI